MIICSCNGLTDTLVRDQLGNACQAPRNVADAYRCCGKRAVCGRCAPSLLGIMRDLAAVLRGQPDAQIEGQPAVA